MHEAIHHTTADADRKAAKLDNINLVLVYLNSLVFAALFPIDSIAAYLVRAMFNGLGIVMVTGLLSLLVGNVLAGIKHPAPQFALFGSYYSSLLLGVFQVILLVVFSVLVVMK